MEVAAEMAFYGFLAYSWYKFNTFFDPDEKTFEPVLEKKRSQVFIRIVEMLDEKQVDAQASVKALGCSDKLSDDPVARQKQLLTLYTGNAVYARVNKCMRQDDEAELRLAASFIRELRDVFRTDLDNRILTPFSGTVCRGIRVANTQAFLSKFTKGTKFVWPAFTSTSEHKSTGFTWTGNIRFEITCSVGIDGAKAQYAPARIKGFSQYQSEGEILFPPHVAFRVVNVCGSTVWLETTEFPSVWELIEAGEWEAFEKWADANPERVDTKDCEFSVITAVGKQVVQSPAFPEVNPLQVCVKYHADINEEDKESGHTLLTLAASGLKHEAPSPCAETLLNWCVESGANPHKKTKLGPTAAEILPAVLAETVASKSFKWDYFVDDRVDFKKEGWYPYGKNAWQEVEKCYGDWRNGVVKDFRVRSRGDSGTNYEYCLDFDQMKQTNVQTNKVRKIRRVAM